MIGSPTWARTRDLRINSPALYRLSYRGKIGTTVIFGSPTWARTRDLRINSPALYRLSYRGIASNYTMTFQAIGSRAKMNLINDEPQPTAICVQSAVA
jgi:hypothetical protein